MHIYTLECEMIAFRSIEETFAIFENPYNLAKITPPQLGFEVTSKDTIKMKRDAEIDYRIKWLGIPMNWKTLITQYEPPFFFEDEQARGPYQLWRHRHTFEAVGAGTKVGDHVDYALPLGPVGRVAHEFVVKEQLRRIFLYRQEQLTKLLGGKTLRTKEPVIQSPSRQ